MISIGLTTRANNTRSRRVNRVHYTIEFFFFFLYRRARRRTDSTAY